MNIISDKRFFYPGILALAWIILTPLYNYPWLMFALTGLLAALAGLRFAEERSVKHFLIGLAGSLLFSLPLTVTSLLKSVPIERFLPSPFRRNWNGLAAMSIPGYPGWMPLFTVGVIISWAVVLYVLFFNCRLLVGNPYYAFIAGIFSVAILFFTGIWACYGFASFYMFFISEKDFVTFILGTQHTRILIGLIPTFSILIFLLVFWTIRNFRHNVPDWKKLLKDLGLFAGGCAAVWFLSAVIALAYGHAAIAESARLFPMEKRPGIPQAMLEADKKQKEWNDQFGMDHPDFQLPMSSTYNWFTGGNKPIPDAIRKKTLDIFQSPKGEEFFRLNSEQIRRYTQELPLVQWDLTDCSMYRLIGWRAVARWACDRAILLAFLERNKEILPALDELVPMENAIEKYRTSIIESLVLFAIQPMRLNKMVQFGPDSPEYATYYRRELDKILQTPIHIPNEAPLAAREVESFFRLKPFALTPEESFYSRLLSFPFNSILFARETFQFIALKDEADALSKQTVMGPMDNRFIPETGEAIYRKAIIIAACRKSLYSIALSLKLYRCEKGEYPKTLQELVPQYLKQLPVDPTDGSQLVYERLPDGSFHLSMPASSYRGLKSKLEFLRGNEK